VELVGGEVARNVAQAAVFAALIGAFAYVAIPYPLSPAPVTLQVLGVFLAGLLLGPVWGAAAMVLYLAAGALGAPVFAQGSAGLGVLVGPTGGYLFSYPLAALAVGYVAHGGFEFRSLAESSVPRMVAGMAAGTLVIYGIGVPWFASVQVAVSTASPTCTRRSLMTAGGTGRTKIALASVPIQPSSTNRSTCHDQSESRAQSRS
jgi:biotin transport system substrate-specific component